MSSGILNVGTKGERLALVFSKHSFGMVYKLKV